MAVLASTSLLIAQLFQRRLGLTAVLRLIRLPLVLATSGLVFALNLPKLSPLDPWLLVVLGGVAGGLVHMARASVRQVGSRAFLTDLTSRLLAWFETTLALGLVACALAAPLLVPVLSILGLVLLLRFILGTARRVGRFLLSLHPYLQSILPVLRVAGAVSHRHGPTIGRLTTRAARWSDIVLDASEAAAIEDIPVQPSGHDCYDDPF